MLNLCDYLSPHPARVAMLRAIGAKMRAGREPAPVLDVISGIWHKRRMSDKAFRTWMYVREAGEASVARRTENSFSIVHTEDLGKEPDVRAKKGL